MAQTGRRGKWHRIGDREFDAVAATKDPYAVAVYVTLCRFRDASGSARVSAAFIHERTGVSLRKVRYVLRDLENAGFISAVRSRSSDGADDTNRYEVLEIDGSDGPGGTVHPVHQGGAYGAGA